MDVEGERNAHKFSISNAFKDMRASQLMMHVVGAPPIPSATQSRIPLPSAVSAGAAEDYVPMLATHIARLNGVDLVPKSAGAEPQAAE